MPQTQPTGSLVVDPQGQGFLSQRVPLWWYNHNYNHNHNHNHHNHNHNHNHNHYNNYHRDTAGIRNPSCWPSAPPWSRLVDVEPSRAVWTGPVGGGFLGLVPSLAQASGSSSRVRGLEPDGGSLSGSPEPSAWPRTLPQAVAALRQQGWGMQGAV